MPLKIKPGHDPSFKNLILDYLRDALAFFARVEAGRLPPDAVLTPLSEQRLREWLGERGAIQDVVVQVEFPGGEREMLVFCIEHNTRESRHILKRQAKYCIQASIQFGTDRIVPVAIFPEERGAVKERFKLATEHGVYMDFKCITVKLKELDARLYMKSQNVVARMCLPFMKFEPAEKFKTYASAYRGLKKLEADAEKRLKYVGFLQQYVNLKDEERQFQEQEVLGSPFEEDYMSTYEYAVREGMKKGEKKGEMRGEKKGVAKGVATVVVDLISSGTISAKQAQRRLDQLVATGELTREIADSAIRQIRGA